MATTISTAIRAAAYRASRHTGWRSSRLRYPRIASAPAYLRLALARRLKLQCEMEDPGFPAKHLAKVEAGLDHADLVADPPRHQRGLRIIENDAFLAVEPALALVDLGDDRGDAEWQDLVLQQPGLGVKDFALPSEMIDE